MGMCMCPEENPSYIQNMNGSLISRNASLILTKSRIENKTKEPNEKDTTEKPLLEPIQEVDSYKEGFNKSLLTIGVLTTKTELQECISTAIKEKDEAIPYIFPKYDDSQLHLMNPVKFTNGNIYEGHWNDKHQMEGQGEIFLFNENIYAKGIWKEGEFHNGRVYFPNGAYYEGEILNSIFHGQGTLVMNDKTKYQCHFENGLRHGEGEILFPDGSHFKGNFVNDHVNGNGIFKWSNQLTYEGNFNDLMLEGYGLLTNGNNSQYEGDFHLNQFHGKGKYTWSNGNEYVGDYKAGNKDGKGTFIKSGFKYKGTWRDNLPHGTGEVEQNNIVYRSYWRNGSCIETPEIIGASIEDSSAIIELMNFNVEVEDMNPLDLKYLITEQEKEKEKEKKHNFNASRLVSFSPSEIISYD